MEVGHSVGYGILKALGMHSALAYVVLLLISAVLTGVGVVLIAKRLGASMPAASVGGAIATFACYRSIHYEHIQILATYWMLLPVYLTISYYFSGERKHLIAAGFSHLPVLFGPSYNLTALLITQIILLVFFLGTGLPDLAQRIKRVGQLAFAVSLAIVPTVPVWLGYIEVLNLGLKRTHTDFGPYAMDLASFLTPMPDNVAYGDLLDSIRRSANFHSAHTQYFIGFAALLLLVYAMFRRVGIRGLSDTEEHALWAARAIKTAGIGLLLVSLGATVTWNRISLLPNPVYRLVESVHLLAATRYIAHFAYLGIVFLSIVAAIYLTQSIAQQSCRRRLAVCIALFSAIYFENLTTFAKWVETLPANVAGTPPIYIFLSTLPRAGVVFLPLPRYPSNEASVNVHQFEYMRFAEEHRQWMINGISGFIPPATVQAAGALAEFPSREGLKFLLANKVEYVVFDRRSTLAQPEPDAARSTLCHSMTKVYEDYAFAVYVIDERLARECLGADAGQEEERWVFDASDLPRQIGQFDVTQRLLIANLGQSGFVSFGPYLQLKSGRYRASYTIRCFCDDRGNELGYVDVYSGGRVDKERTLARIPVLTAPGDQSVELEFQAAHQGLHEFRVWGNGQRQFAVRRIVVERLR